MKSLLVGSTKFSSTSNLSRFLCGFISFAIGVVLMLIFFNPGILQGGILWFQDLTVSANGPFGCIFPFIVAGLHFCNVQVPTKSPSQATVITGEGLLVQNLYSSWLIS